MKFSNILGKGLIVLFVVAAFLSFAVNGFLWLGHMFSYEGLIKRAYEHPETRRRIIEMFHLIESRSIDSELELLDAKLSEDCYGYPKTRRLPDSRMIELQEALRKAGAPYFPRNECVAYYDKDARF